MRIPSNDADRLEFVLELIRKCKSSMNDRTEFYRSMRAYFITGSDNGTPAHFNKILPHIDALSAYLYAADSTRFTCHLGESAEPSEIAKCAAMERVTEDAWSDTNADMLFGEAVKWALVYNSMFVKVSWHKGVELKVIEPEYIGVLREDVPGLSSQEAFTVRYPITKTELIDRLYTHPRREKLVEQLSFEVQQQEQTTVMDKIILSASSPNVIGNAPLQVGAMEANYTPKLDEETVWLTELFVWNDEDDDFQVFTVGDPNVIIYDRPCAEMVLKGEPGVVQICPDPLPRYFWGLSEVDRLRFLQDMRNKRVSEILHLLSKQSNPPKVYSGFEGIMDEKNSALDNPGGFVFSSIPGSKVDPLTPQISQDMYEFLEKIDLMFGEASGIGSILMGEGAPGVRSASQASTLAKLGGSRAKKRAMIIEDSLEKVATIVAKLQQTYNKEELHSTDGSVFLASQFTSDYVMRVDAHSNSPLFVDDNRALAFNLLKAGVISKERFIEMVNPPMKQGILADLKIAEQNQANQPPQPPQGEQQQSPKQGAGHPPLHRAK